MHTRGGRDCPRYVARLVPVKIAGRGETRPRGHLTVPPWRRQTKFGQVTEDKQESLTVRDNRTGQEYDVPITDGAIKAADIGAIKAGDDQPGLAVYDPGFVNTASCRSAVTYIDGEQGILEYRGYPIEQLAEKSTFLEVSYLLVHGYGHADADRLAWEALNRVGMVEAALNGLSERNLVDLDDERKAAMVSNLLVVLCGERGTQPIVNAGSIY